MRRAIVIVLDGLRRDMVGTAATPELASHATVAEQFAQHRSVFPSATRVVSASFATGCHPARHELAGNSLVLVEDGRLVAHDAGHPEFLQHKRRVTGRSLAMPTMAERLADRGGVIVMANASPGAAYAHDPDGHGHVYHRAGSFGPGRKPVEGWNASEVQLGHGGDRILAERFVADVVLGQRPPALGVLWCAEPDTVQHAEPLGSPAHLATLRAADALARTVIDAVAEARRRGDDILLAVMSDHGHETIEEVIDVEAELVAGGVKAHAGSGDVIAVSNGTSSLVYVHPDHAPRVREVGAFLARQRWAGRVVGPEEHAEIGQAPHHGLAFAVAMASRDQANAFGVPGLSFEAKPAPGKAAHLGCGQHGGLARYEQMPFLMLQGPGFRSGAVRQAPSSVVDLAPTILAHLGVAHEALDGRALQSSGA
jgi:arylsulfatase A-like enzyme